jgi:hypothetical protein
MNIFKKSAAVIATGAVAFLLAGCTYVTAGTITDKKFVKAHTTTTTTCVGKPLVCTPHIIPHADEWDVLLTAKQEDGEMKSSWVEVSQARYDELAIGDFYDAQPGD